MRNGKLTKFVDLQSLLLRFLPFTINNTKMPDNRSDVFALQDPKNRINKILMKNFQIACTKIGNNFRSSKCSNTDWASDLFNHKIDYKEL